MSELNSGIKVGQMVPNFELTIYRPDLHSFGKICLEEQKEKGKWTILFFYPADFTFV